MRRPVKLFIVEGKDRDYRFVNDMVECFFKGRYLSTIINLPASQNIYMLYQKLLKDEFETDVVEVLKETVEEAKIKLANIKRQEIDEVFLFFDYDIQQNNTPKSAANSSEMLTDLLDFFNNETENGQLYISYPMVEALYDYCRGECNTFSKCVIPFENLENYKNMAGNLNPNANKKRNFLFWKEVLNVFYLRIKCLFNNDTIDYRWYRENVNPQSIYFSVLNNEIEYNGVFVLSAFPEFLFDYFKENFWQSMTPIKKKRFSHCQKENKSVL